MSIKGANNDGDIEKDNVEHSNNEVVSQNPMPSPRNVNFFISISREVQNSGVIESSVLASFKCNNVTSSNYCADENTHLSSLPVAQENKIVNCVLSQLFLGSCPQIEKLANDWINTYKSIESEALRSVLELVLHTVGLRCSLQKDTALKLHHLTIDTLNNWIAKSEIRPIVLNKIFLKNLSKFFKLILTEKVLINGPFMRQIEHLLSVVMDSKWVAARYTAMVVGSEITNCYIQLLMEIESKINNTTAGSCLESLKENGVIVKNLFNDFTSLVLLCLRDVVLMIRKHMFERFWNWCKVYPAIFVNDYYLKHVFWALYDTDTYIRASAIGVCSILITSETFAGNLNKFVGNTLPSIFKRIYDTKSTVAVSAVKSLAAIHRKIDVFKFGRQEKVFEQIFCKCPAVARASASFLYQLLSEFHNDSTQFIKEIITFLHETELVFDGEFDDELVRAMLSCASKQLTDWPAWTTLLLRTTLKEHHQEVACRLLSTIIHQSIFMEVITTPEVTKYVPPAQSNNVKEVNHKSNLKKKQQDVCKKNQSDVTNYFGRNVVLLCNNYKTNQDCLIHLLKIPRQFSNNIHSVDMKRLCSYLISFESNNPEVLEQWASTLAFLHYIMKSSPKWQQGMLILEKHLFGAKYRRACEVLSTCVQPEESSRTIQESMTKLRSVYCLSKYFDLTQTEMLDDSLEAFKYGRKKLHPEIIRYTANTCMYIVQWQLKNIVEHKCARDVPKTQLYKLQSQIRTINMHLEDLICTSNYTIREIVFLVLCRLRTVFCSENSLIKLYTLIHLPPLSQTVVKWLDFHLYSQVSSKTIPTEKHKFVMSSKVLSEFCRLLSCKVLPMSCIASTLPYFLFYDQARNYNTPLIAALKSLILISSFPVELVQALTTQNEKEGHHTVEVMARGLSSLLSRAAKPVRRVNDVASSIVCYGLLQIVTHNDHLLFPVLSPFVKLLSKKEALRLKSLTLDTFHLFTEDIFVKQFLNAFRK